MPDTQREAVSLAGEWYVWFTAPHEDQPGEAWHWNLAYDDFETALALPPKRQRARVLELSRLPSFLAERGKVLSVEAQDALLDAVKDEFGPALRLEHLKSLNGCGQTLGFV